MLVILEILLRFSLSIRWDLDLLPLLVRGHMIDPIEWASNMRFVDILSLSITKPIKMTSVDLSISLPLFRFILRYLCASFPLAFVFFPSFVQWIICKHVVINIFRTKRIPCTAFSDVQYIQVICSTQRKIRIEYWKFSPANTEHKKRSHTVIKNQLGRITRRYSQANFHRFSRSTSNR